MVLALQALVSLRMLLPLALVGGPAVVVSVLVISQSARIRILGVLATMMVRALILLTSSTT